jgi:hypothetical protein
MNQLSERYLEDFAVGQTPDGRASLRHDNVLDGIDTLPDENAQARQHRDGATCSGYNIKRVMRLLGVGGLIEAIRT